MADKSDLKAQLERKKQRLAQIREEKKRMEEERKKETETQQKAEAAPVDSDLDRKRRETEAILQSIGISPETPLGTQTHTLHISSETPLDDEPGWSKWNVMYILSSTYYCMSATI
uniref:Dynein cytoplasmic 1 intermediate chain 1 n=1 Tax=Hucho hucho TaxID=62062 RepID=A0A4W5LN14_9TELE